MDLIYELGTNAIPHLADIDLIFEQIHIALNSKPVNKKFIQGLIVDLEHRLSLILKTDVFIHFYYSGDWIDNFGVMPIINPKSSDVKNDIVNMNLFAIERLHFFIGSKLIASAQPKQMTAILLHEIGHVTKHVSVLTSKIETLLHHIQFAFSYITLLKILFFPILIITSRSLNFKNHIDEYDADKFVNKYGYGDELASWLSNESKLLNIKNNKRTGLMIVYDTIIKFLFGESHPDFDKRLLEVVNNMKQTYSKEYDTLKLNQILNDYYKNKRI